MLHGKVWRFVLLVALVGLLCACTDGTAPSPTLTVAPPVDTLVVDTPIATPLPSDEAPTLTPTITTAETSAPDATATAEPTAEPSATETALPPTVTPEVAPPLPTAASEPTAVRVSFAIGATSASIEGDLPAHGVARYVVRANARQILEADVTSAQVVYLGIQGADGTVLQNAGGPPAYRGALPVTQDYALTLTAGDQTATYTLTIIIPARVAFVLGTTSGVVNGTLPAYGRNYYVLGAQAGQLMDVTADSSATVGLSIYGLDGTVLLSAMGDASFFRGLLPSTQDYMVVVRTADSAANYSLNVMIPERIRFAAGAIGAKRQAKLGAHQQHAYVLGAGVGQTMKVSVTAPGDGVRLVIYGVDGTVLMSGMGEGTEFEGILPSTQDYIVNVDTGDAARVYTLEVTITG